MTSIGVHSASSLLDPADTFFVIGAAIFTSLISEGTLTSSFIKQSHLRITGVVEKILTNCIGEECDDD
jgi:hypothetical protein